MRFLIRRFATRVNSSIFKVNTARHASNDAQKKEPTADNTLETKVEEIRKSTYIFNFVYKLIIVRCIHYAVPLVIVFSKDTLWYKIENFLYPISRIVGSTLKFPK